MTLDKKIKAVTFLSFRTSTWSRTVEVYIEDFLVRLFTSSFKEHSHNISQTHPSIQSSFRNYLALTCIVGSPKLKEEKHRKNTFARRGTVVGEFK